jgi:CRISPR-associated protein Csm1
MEEKRFHAAIAGLLHDVGKIEQRARTDPWAYAPSYSAADGQPVHATWSGYFIQNYIPAPYRSAALAGAYHHSPDKSPADDKSLSFLVALADKLSAGERADLPAGSDKKKPPKQMVTIFDRVRLKSPPRSAGHYLPLKILELGENLFPTEGEKDNGNSYENLRTWIENHVPQETSSPEAFLESMLSVLQQAAWFVPSAYYHSLPDVSLYDHSRMTAAIAVCLSDFAEDRIQKLLDAVKRDFTGQVSGGDQGMLNAPVALLVGGDISGIQKFIYTLSSKGAARTLRGRSLYLQLLTEAILRYILKELGLPYSNVIYSGGGHFYLLAPLSADAKLGEIRRQVSCKLLKHHGASLYLAVGSTEVPAAGFKLGRFPEYWDQMHAALGKAKQHRYAELGEEIYPLVFAPRPHGGNRDKICSVCGDESIKVEQLGEDGESEHICQLCASFGSQLGKRLPQADTIVIGIMEPASRDPGTALDALAEFGIQVALPDRNRGDQPVDMDPTRAERIVAWMLGDTPQTHLPGLERLPVTYVRRYMVNQVPQESFDMLQKKADGIPRLGVLRMDVDNLGAIFKEGFKDPADSSKSIATLARLSTLSYQMSLFFEGWVKRMCEQTSPDIYAVYAGGDDLFLIAPWHLVPGLAQSVNEAFARYTAGNPDIRISGGMAFIHGKYPVYQAAEDAREALEKAKGLPGKNAFTFLDHAWKWDTFKQIAGNKESLISILSGEESGPQSLLQVLRQLAEMQAEKAGKKKDQLVWGPWMWKGDYQLTRMVEREDKKHSPAAGKIKNILEDMHTGDIFYQHIDRWGAAARWAQLVLRKQTDHE